jgi:hypothetical protein
MGGRRARASLRYRAFVPGEVATLAPFVPFEVADAAADAEGGHQGLERARLRRRAGCHRAPDEVDSIHGTPAAIPTEPISFAGPIRWSSDGEAVLFTDSSWEGSAEWDGSAEDLWAVDVSGGTPRLLLRDVAGPFDSAPPGR